jgi:secondary thiamine-phosphate synthase enzyme
MIPSCRAFVATKSSVGKENDRTVRQHQEELEVTVRGTGLYEITDRIREVLHRSGIQIGMCHVFVRHTSASLLIQEDADPSARHDLERWFARLVPEDDPAYSHTAEGPDDMPAHLKAALTSTSELIPVMEGNLGLGTWQGLYLFEHRRRTGRRHLIVHLWGE